MPSITTIPAIFTHTIANTPIAPDGHILDIYYPVNHTVACIFSHGVAGTYKQAKKYTLSYNKQLNAYPTIIVPTTSFNYPDATEHLWRVHFWRTCFGQKSEILALKKVIDTAITHFQKKLLSLDISTALPKNHQLFPDTSTVASHNNLLFSDTSAILSCKNSLFPTTDHHKPPLFILYGVSRGASTILNYIAHHPKTAHIAAIIAESPYDHIHSVAHAFACRYALTQKSIERTTSCIYTGINTLFFRYNSQGPHPVHHVHLIPHHIPVLIICSLHDTLVPWHSSYALYAALRNAGHPHAHIAILNHGAHARMLSKEYYYVVHAFYKKYGLPYHEKAALHGESLLAESQP